MDARFKGKDKYGIEKGKEFSVWIHGLELEIDMGDRELLIRYHNLKDLAEDWEIKEC